MLTFDAQRKTVILTFLYFPYSVVLALASMTTDLALAMALALALKMLASYPFLVIRGHRIHILYLIIRQHVGLRHHRVTQWTLNAGPSHHLFQRSSAVQYTTSCPAVTLTLKRC